MGRQGLLLPTANRGQNRCFPLNGNPGAFLFRSALKGPTTPHRTLKERVAKAEHA